MSVSVIIPTRQRLERALHAVKTLRQATGDVELVVVVDNDPDTFDALLDTKLFDTLIYNDRRQWAIASWNIGAKAATGDYLFTGADDLSFQAGWLDEALRALDQKLNGYGVVAINDGHNSKEGPSTHILIERQFARDHLGGVLWCPHYKHYFVDNELKERTQALDRFHYCKTARVEHLHPAAGKAESDPVYKEAHRFWGKDEATFERRKAQGFPNDYEAVL